SDSAATLRAARRAQASFEWFRGHHLPERDDYPSGHCDLNIGRYCFWYGDRKFDSVPEPPMIQEERGRLLAALATATARLPGDDWIVGQRVRYLVEEGRRTEAVAIARACRGTPWWCAALAGFALHAAAEFASADSAFEAALVAMPDEERCRWRDVAVVLPPALRERYDRMSCTERADFESRWWWLTTPLASRPGNDRRTEHFSRLTLDRLLRDSRSARRDPWGDDQRELLLRFGPEVSWSRRPSSPFTQSDPLVTGHERVPAFHFVPSSRAFDDPGRSRTDDWALDDARPNEWYAPPYADRFLPLNAQLAAFRRGDSCLVAAVYDVSADPTLGHQPAQTALVVAQGERWHVVRSRETHLDGREALIATGRCEPELVSLEVVSSKARWVARLRQGIEPPGPGSVSDLLLVDPRDSLARDLRSLLPYALASNRIPVGSHVRLFWEVPGLDPAGEPVTTSLAVTAEPRGWLGRTAESIGLARRRRGVELRWDEVLRPQAGVAPRLLDLDLSALSAGRYRIDLAVSVGGGVPLTATREIELVAR
ncbi:MAG TPA: hypothetical protein VHO95_01085, partial [Candidatus Dormibacteraeota bacterium]|nr:hypothetical protein [Candidatus Dormibacteraeota bacterium]